MEPKYILVAAVVFVMGWFAFGVIYNLRLGDRMLRWIQSGLPRVGERTKLRWLGTSVVELVIEKARMPFKRLDTLLVLSPRDVPWMWILASYQGRRDTIIFRAHLNRAPSLEFDLADPSSWTGKMVLKQSSERGWQSGRYEKLQLMTPPGTFVKAESALKSFDASVRLITPTLWRFSVRRTAPHLELHFAFPNRNTDATQMIEALRNLARLMDEQR